MPAFTAIRLNAPAIRYVCLVALFMFAKSSAGQLLSERETLASPRVFCDEVEDARFGEILALGDLDGDDQDDLVVATIRPFFEEAVFVYYSEGSEYASEPSVIDIDARSVSVGEFNGDAFEDLLIVTGVGAWAFYGSAERLPAFPDPLADADWSYVPPLPFSAPATALWKLATPVDRFSADGIDDIVIGSPDTGEAFNFQSSSGSGLSLAPSGSVFGEGQTLLCGPAANRVLGSCVLYDVAGSFGSAIGRGPQTSPALDHDSVLIGVPGAAIDLDDDGLFEAPEANAGAVKVDFSQLLAGDLVPGVEFGHELGAAGDVDDDGIRDAIISAKRFGSTAPKVFVYLGQADLAAGASRPDYDWAVEEPEQRELAGLPNPFFDTFGEAVGHAGDVNADGFDDIFIGDPRYDVVGGRDQSEFGFWGRGYIWFGGAPTLGDPTGLGANPTPASADIKLNAKGLDADFGQAFASGDVNGDGGVDLVVGIPRAATQCIDEGSGQQFFRETGSVRVFVPEPGSRPALASGLLALALAVRRRRSLSIRRTLAR